MVYKLTYFNIRGLAEPIRLLLADNGIAFEDLTVSKDEWQTVKNNFQFGQIPCLVDGSQQIVQSGAINRHLARKHKLNGTSEEETTFIDMFFEGLRDIHDKYVKVIYHNYEDGKDALINETYPVEFGKLEKLLKTYNNGEKYVAGEKVSYADYHLYDELDIALILSPTVLDKFPTLKAFHHRFATRPSLKAFHDRRAKLGYPVNNNGKQ